MHNPMMRVEGKKNQLVVAAWAGMCRAMGVTCLICVLVGMVPSVGYAQMAYPLGQNSILSERAVSERLKSAAQVCVSGQACAGKKRDEIGLNNESSSLAQADAPQQGEQTLSAEGIYQQFCSACHTSGAAGAPKFGEAAAWQARADAKGFVGLVDSVKNGLGIMPAKGMCAACDDADLQSVVAYLLSESNVAIDIPELAADDAGPSSATPPGKDTYESYCKACHDSGLAGAPKWAEEAAWSDRVAQGKATLVRHVVDGYNIMPKMGGCATCSEQDIFDVVDYMLSALPH